MTADWSTMVQHVVIAGRPGDVKSAAWGWEEILTRLDEVKAVLEHTVTELGTSWSGPAYEAFRAYMHGPIDALEEHLAAARAGGGIVRALHEASDALARAQQAMPVPHRMAGTLLAARDARITLDAGACELSVRGEFFDNPFTEVLGGGIDYLESFLHDVEHEATRVYDQLATEYRAINQRLERTQVNDSKSHQLPDTRTPTPPLGGTGGPYVPPPSGYSPGGSSGSFPGGLPSAGSLVAPFGSHPGEDAFPGSSLAGFSPDPHPTPGSTPGSPPGSPSGSPGGGQGHPTSPAGTPGLAPTPGRLGSTGSTARPISAGAVGALPPGASSGMPAVPPGGGALGRPVDVHRSLTAGAGGAGAGAPGMGMGMAGMPAAMPKETKGQYSVWLREDPSTWQPEEDLPPAVLGRPAEATGGWPGPSGLTGTTRTTRTTGMPATGGDRPRGVERLRFVQRD